MTSDEKELISCRVAPEQDGSVPFPAPDLSFIY